MNDFKEWHDARDIFAARELSYPLRRWYERAAMSEVEQWHTERNAGWAFIHRCQRIMVVPFGYSRISRWLNTIVTRAVQARWARRDAARIATVQHAR